jgi:hypothetical protein
MSGPYFQKAPWPAFVYQDQRYCFDHLEEYIFCVNDAQSISRQIAVTFSDHCFTREWADGDDRQLIYPMSSRQSGCFCFDRYQYSLDIRRHIQWATNGNVWNSEGTNVAIIPTVIHQEQKMFYRILFSLDPVTGLPMDLRMHVRSAHLCDKKAPDTFGHVRFSHLVSLRLQKKHPKKFFEHRRKRPRLGRL